jgi:hypothetical protein
MKRILSIVLVTLTAVALAFGMFLYLTQQDRSTSSAGDGSLPDQSIEVWLSRGQLDKVNLSLVADGTRAEDSSPDSYASVFEDVPISNDRGLHLLSVELRADTSPFVQAVMHFLGGREPLAYFAYFEPQTGDLGAVSGDVEVEALESGWYRIKVMGRNNKSGNTTARLQFYPRHGEASDMGAVVLRNARFH